MKKRIIARVRALICALALAVNMIPTVYAVSPQVRVSSVTVTPGGVCTVTVTGENLSNLTSLELMLAYDASALTVVETSTASMDIATVDSKTAGFIRYSGISMDGISGTNDLLTISFLAAADADIRDYTISAFVAGATAWEGGADKNVTLSVLNGSVTIKAEKSLNFRATISDSAIEAGEAVTMTVSCSSTYGLAGGQFVFSYDSTLFEYESFALLDAMKVGMYTYTVNDMNPGRIMVSFVSDDAVSYGKLMSITLRAKEFVSGTSEISFEPKNLIDTETNSLTGTTTSKTVAVSEKVQVWVDQPASSIPHEKFSVGFWAAGASGLAAGDFSVSYDSEILDCLSVSTSLSSGENGQPANGYVVINDDWKDGAINFSVLCPQGISRDTCFVVMEFQVKSHTENSFELTPKVETTPVDRQGTTIQFYSTSVSGEIQTEVYEDENKDHKCDACGEIMTSCVDTTPKDHKCDVCEAPMGDAHEAAVGKHTCDYCGETVSGCIDEDSNHQCDVCGETIAPTYEPGDANHDGNADSDDAVMILRNLAGYEVPNFYEDTADFNGDGKADSDDAVAILRKLAGY